MAHALRLTTLSYVVAHANAQWFRTSPGSGGWAPVTPTAEPEAPNSERLWSPKTTAHPDDRPLRDWELRRRDNGLSTICGYDAGRGEPRSSPVTCGSDEFCGLDRRLGVVGCCTGTNPRSCVVPTSCLDSSKTAQWTGDSLTTYCGDPNRPHCVTRSYDANFYDELYGAYFVGCAAQAATGDIVASLTSETNTGVTGPTATSTNASSGSGGSHGSSHAGAIAGGVVGGIAGLVLIAAAILFFIRRRKKRSQELNPLSLPPALGRKMPPSDNDMYQNEEIPGSQYPSTFYGEVPPGMVQMSEQPLPDIPPNAYGVPPNTYEYIIRDDNNPSAGAPVYIAPLAVPPRIHGEAVSPLDESSVSPVSPVSPATHYNTVISALSDSSPPLQPLRPAVRRQQDIYAQYIPQPPTRYSPSPPTQYYHSYNTYPEA